MAEFVDASGNAWQVRVDVSTIKRVRDKYGIDLAKILSSQKDLMKLADDVVLLVDTLFAVVNQQAVERGIDAEQFACSLSGDVIEHATNALMEAIIDFFPQGRRTILRQLWEKVREADRMLVTEAGDRINQLTFGPLSTNTPVMPE